MNGGENEQGFCRNWGFVDFLYHPVGKLEAGRRDMSLVVERIEFVKSLSDPYHAELLSSRLG